MSGRGSIGSTGAAVREDDVTSPLRQCLRLDELNGQKRLTDKSIDNPGEKCRRKETILTKVK